MYKFLILSFCCLFIVSPSHAGSDLQSSKISLNEWSTLPVLHEGRVKPLDSFSSILLEQISGKNTIEGMNSNEWLAQAIFSPDDAIFLKIFKIKNADIFNLDKKQLYDFTVVSEVLDKNQEMIDKLKLIPNKDLSIEQKNLLDLYDNHGIYNQLLRSVTALIPLNIKNKTEPTSYFELYQSSPRNVEKFLESKIIRAAGSNNIYFKIIPQDNLKQTYATIWQILLGEAQDDQSIRLIESWKNLTIAYRQNDPKMWDNNIAILKKPSSPLNMILEKLYNDLSLVTVSFLLFLISLAVLIMNEIIKRKSLLLLSSLALSTGSVAITIDLIMRVIITHRPPVGTLYESILFVCMITALSCAFFAWKKNQNKVALFIGSVSSTILLLTANSFVGLDSFSPLVAVLNTDFWLATHVIIITAGYAFCILTAMYAHIMMWRQDYNKKSAPYKNLNVFMILSLLFVTVGTVLGGLWADQSWGRFWGWDPKENGALLIALWIIWLLHGKITHDMPIKFYMAGVCFLSVIVALAWFGVNLLSVGLHSYGFISGIALGLGLFCAAETLIIGYLTFLHRRKENKAI